jgi:uncharacterized protein (TIGR00255 family)
MTGYGEASAQVGGAHFFVEVRSLNSKYFKATIRLPDEYQGLEAEMEQVLRTLITRGTVTVNARCADATETAAFEINAKALNRYVEQIKLMPKVEGVTPVVDTAALLSLPGVLQPPANEEERFERARSAFIPLLQKALKQLIEMRDREGRALQEDLESHRKDIAQRLVDIIRLSPQVIADYETRLKARIEALLKDAQINLSQVDLIREIAVYAERTDIAEETKRLTGPPGPVQRPAFRVRSASRSAARWTLSPRKCSARPTPSPASPPTPRSRAPPSRSRARSTASKSRHKTSNSSRPIPAIGYTSPTHSALRGSTPGVRADRAAQPLGLPQGNRDR